MAKPAPTPPPPEVPHPIRERLSVARDEKGWAVVVLKVQGDKVLSEERLTHPGKPVLALEGFKAEFARRVLR